MTFFVKDVIMVAYIVETKSDMDKNNLTQLSLFSNDLENLVKENTRHDDNWVNATKWCKYYGKRFSNFTRLQEIKLFIAKLSKKLGYSDVSKVVEHNSGKDTFIHPLLAIKLAEWLNPDFDICVKETFKRFLDNDITLADEIIQRSQSDDELKWIQARVEGKIARKSFTDELKKRGVTAVGYAMNTDAIYTGLFGKTAKEIKQERQIEHKDTTRDDMTFFELSAIRFAEANAVKRMKKHGSTGNKPTTIDSAITAQILKEAMDKILE